jgi:2-keto-4-pentenoate hydratase/2-oxohepta-3-ene-1,7-dioic acid hydratase in catechol pathway
VNELVRVRYQGRARFGSVGPRGVELLDVAPWLGGRPTGEVAGAGEAPLICPVQPSKILGIGRNYRAHAAELGNEVPAAPLLFLKPPSSLLAPGGRVLLPPESDNVHYEAELGVVIGRACRRVSAARALDYVFGYTAVCDVTARDLQRTDGQWSRAKGFDTFCPVGPCIRTGIAASDLGIVLTIDGQVRQNGRTSQMIFDVPALIEYASAAMTLLPGDLIATGTPEGVGPMLAGNRVRIDVEAVGSLEFDVAHEDAGAAP